MGERIFVYGSLRSDAPSNRNHLLASDATLVGRARAAGRLYQVSWYPGIVFEGGSDAWVKGEVWEIADPEPVFARLDAYEGCGPDDPEPHAFARVRCEVWMESGEWIEVFTYQYVGPLAEARLIRSGDYADAPAA